MITLINNDLFLLISIVTLFTLLMSPTLCWLITAGHRG